MRSDLQISLHAVGYENFRAAVVRSSTRIILIDNRIHFYRQMRGPPLNCAWSVRVDVFERRYLKGVHTSGGSDPYIHASVMEMKRKPDHQRKIPPCNVNKLLFFSKLCTGLGFEDETFVAEGMDWNRFSAPHMVGVYKNDSKRTIGVPGQEIYRKWLALYDPNRGTRLTVLIKLSVSVVQPGNKPLHHHKNGERMCEVAIMKPQ